MSANIDSALYTLGMITRAIWPSLGEADEIPRKLVDTLLTRPLSGVAQLDAEARKRRVDIADLAARLPSDLTDPPGGVGVQHHMQYWLGYYHYYDALIYSACLGAADLSDAGTLLYGERWQSELARAINVGDRRVREWVAGDRSIPAGVWADVAQLLRARSEAGFALLKKFQSRNAE